VRKRMLWRIQKTTLSYNLFYGVII
jgi:hypothetical protein